MRELRGLAVMTVAHVPTAENPADLFTKVLDKQPFEKHRKFVHNLLGDTALTTRAVPSRSSGARRPGLQRGPISSSSIIAGRR